MSDSIQTQANKYKIASEKVLETWPKWKLASLKYDRENNVKNSRFLDDYAKAVIEMAQVEETLSA